MREAAGGESRAQRVRVEVIGELLKATDRAEYRQRQQAAAERLGLSLNSIIACQRFQRLSTAQLVKVTAIWETQVLRLPQPSKLTSAKVQRLLTEATQGYIGLLDMILRESAVRALRSGQTCID